MDILTRIWARLAAPAHAIAGMRSVRNEIGNIMSEVAAYETAASVEPHHHAETRLDARGRGDAARRRPRGDLTVVRRAPAPWPPTGSAGYYD